MICKNCSHENADGEKYCTNCGVPLTDEGHAEEQNLEGAAADVTAEAETTEPVEAVQDEPVADTDVADTYAAEGEEEPQPKKRRGLIAFSGLIALVLIAVGLWVIFTGVFAPKYTVPVDRSKLPITYVKDNKLYQKPVSGKPAQISENLTVEPDTGASSYTNTVVQSKDGKTTYFLENFDQETFSGTLYVSYNGKEKVKIAENVLQGFVVSENGKTVVYMSDINLQTSMGPLYYYTKGIEPQRIAEVSPYRTYMVSQNGKMVAFLENASAETGIGELYVVKTGSKPTKIDDGVLASFKVSNKGEVLYAKNYDQMTYTCDLFTAGAGKAATLVANGVSESYVMASDFSNKIAYVTVASDDTGNQTYNFNSKSGNKAPVSVMENLAGFFTVDVENQNYLLAKLPDDATAMNPDMYLKKGKKDPLLVATGMATPQHASASYDFKTIYYLNEYDQTTGIGKLHVRKESLFGSAKDEVIAEGVSSFTATKDGKTVVYMTNLNEETGAGTLSAYTNGKTKQLAENILSSTYKLSQNGKTVTFIGDLNQETLLGGLYSIRTSGTSGPTAIDSDVYGIFYSRSDKNAIYMKNYNEDTQTADLYLWKGNGKPEAVDTGVATVLFE